MANNCFYNMKVQGKEENVKEFIKIMQVDKYEGNVHMFRIFCAYVYEEGTDENGYYVAKLNGDCAWSVHTCMTEYGYYTDRKDSPGIPTHLAKESERLGLMIDVYSTESGMAFAEHYTFYNGECICDETVDYFEYMLDEYESVEEANEDLDINLTKEEFDFAIEENEGYIEVGGFGDYEFADIIDFTSNNAA